MDFDSFETDLKSELMKLPKELLGHLKALAEKFGNQLEPIVKSLMASLMPHIQVIMLEKAMGTLNADDLNQRIMKILREAL